MTHLDPLLIRVACEMIAVGSGQSTISSTFLLTSDTGGVRLSCDDPMMAGAEHSDDPMMAGAEHSEVMQHLSL